MAMLTRTRAKSEWLIPAGLMVLSILPAIGGFVRLAQFGSSGPITPDHERFAAAPMATVLHVVAAMMLRSYALGLGAGTQALTHIPHIPWFLFPSIHGEFARTVFMVAGWAINLAVAEWLIARKQPRLRRSVGAILVTAALLGPAPVRALDFQIPPRPGHVKPDRWPMTRLLSTVFDQHRLLVLGVAHAWTREWDALRLDILAHGLPFRCQDVLVEASPAQTFLEDAYIQPERHQAAMQLGPALKVSPWLDGLYHLNRERPAAGRVSLLGFDGMGATTQATLAAWRLFLALDVPALKRTPLGTLVAQASDRTGLLAIRDYLQAHEAAIGSQLQTPRQRQRFQIVATAIDDVFRRSDVVDAYQRPLSNEAKKQLRIRLSTRHLAVILANYPERRFLISLGIRGGLNERPAGLAALQREFPALDSTNQVLCVGFGQIDLTGLTAYPIGAPDGAIRTYLRQRAASHPTEPVVPFWQLLTTEQDPQATTWQRLQQAGSHDPPCLIRTQDYPDVRGTGCDAWLVLPVGHFNVVGPPTTSP
jgi:hypothetical protein